MGRYFTLALSITGEQKPKAKKITAGKSAGEVKFNMGMWLLVLIVFFGVLYLTEANSMSTKGYEMVKLEQQIANLQDSNKKLQTEAASLKSIQNIENEVKSLNLVPNGSVQYPVREGYAFQK
ncbi:hypothetical protein D4R52_02020 [bacterium]|nr:MAG: hypothetical protein D4R52_02020 [bacterium]